MENEKKDATSIKVTSNKWRYVLAEIFLNKVMMLW